MPATLDLGYTVGKLSPMSGIPQIPMTDYSIKMRNNGQIVLINAASPIDRIQEIRYQMREIPDIYKNTGINPAVMSPNRTGRNVAVVFSCVGRVTDPDCCEATRDLPLKATLSLTVPNDAMVDALVVRTLIKSAMSSWVYPSEWVGVSAPAWNHAFSLIKGALEPDLTQASVG